MADGIHRRAADELYVNYMPMPAGIGRFLRFAVPITLWVICGLSFVWARSQNTPGDAVWETAQPIELRGYLDASSYPVLFARSEDGSESAVMLVEQGKKGGQGRAQSLHGKMVRASGWLLHRDGRRILELEPDSNALRAEAVPVESPRLNELGPVTLRGEIVDGKCYLGAMKPGEGKTHKDCATLCIRGGIPPVFVSTRPDGQREYLLLQSETGGMIDPEVHGMIADPVEISGVRYTWGNDHTLGVLRARAKDVRRL